MAVVVQLQHIKQSISAAASVEDKGKLGLSQLCTA